MKIKIKSLSVLVSSLISIASYAQGNSVRDTLDNLLQWEEAFGFSGSVLIVKEGKIILNKGYGFADNKARTANTAKTDYYIASVSKPITALAIMKLVEQKQIRLDDRITKYFSNVPKLRQRITVEHLLAHTSGLDHTYSCDNITNREKAIEIILNETPQVDPAGKAYHYSGDNYTLLAAIIEIVTKDTFEKYVTENILAPAGIPALGENNAAFVGQLSESIPGQLAAPIEGSTHKTLKDITPSWGRKGRAGMILSVEDLYKLDSAFISNKIVHANTVASILSARNTNPGANYGLGFTLGETTRGTKVFGHSGDDDGIGHNVDYLNFPDDDVKIFIASNSGMYSGTSWSAIVSSIVQRVLLPSNYTYSDTPFLNYKFDTDRVENAESLIGVYESSSGISFHVWINSAAQLIISPVGEEVAKLIDFSNFYSDKNQLTRTLLEEAVKGEFSSWKDLAKNDESFEKVKSLVVGQLRAIGKNGPIEAVNILGTANIWSSNYQAEIATWFQLISKDNPLLFRIEWDNTGKIAGLGGGRIQYPIMFQLKEVSENKFIGFDVANGRTLAVSFLTGGSHEKTRLTITIGGSQPQTAINTGNTHLLPKRSAAQHLYRVIITRGSQAAVEEVSTIMNHLPSFDIKESELNDMGYKLLNQGRLKESITLFTIITNGFPDSSNAFDSLGEAYLKAGNKAEALRCYKKAVELNPNNKTAKRIVNSLK